MPTETFGEYNERIGNTAYLVNLGEQPPVDTLAELALEALRGREATLKGQLAEVRTAIYTIEKDMYRCSSTCSCEGGEG